MGGESKHFDIPTIERVFTLQVVLHKSVALRIPQAPGYRLNDESTEEQRALYAELYQGLEHALRAMIDGLPFARDRFEFFIDYDRGEGYEFVRLMLHDHIVRETVFFPDGYVREQESEVMPEWDAKSWKDGFRLLLASLRENADLDMKNAALQLERLNAMVID
jgi:hypothetical protein